MTRRAVRLVAAFAAVAAFVAFGGLDALRWAHARWRASLEPPTVEQVQRALPEPTPLRASLSREAVRGKMWLSDPPRPMAVAVVLASILTGTVALMFVTGRGEK
jgi:RsiW-degrading membrane proteinase PrsW (M82 family)